MKRFQWSLQRLLDVRVQQERALRMELFRLSSELAAVHREIIRRQTSLRLAMTDLASRPLADRMAAQASLVGCFAAEESQLSRLRAKLGELQARRAEKVGLLARAKSSRETLERLRREALERHTREALKEEQKQSDESSQAAFARELLSQRAAGPT